MSSALYPDRPVPTSPFKKFQHELHSQAPRLTRPANGITSGAQRVKLSPTKTPAIFSRSLPSSLESSRKPIFASAESLASNLSSSSDQTFIRRTGAGQQNERDRRGKLPLRSPVKLRATTDRLARQANEIIEALGSGITEPKLARPEFPSREFKRPLPRSPNHRVNVRSTYESEKKRRKVVSFEDHVMATLPQRHVRPPAAKPVDNSTTIQSTILQLQEQVNILQKFGFDQAEEIRELRKLLLEQSRLINGLLGRK